MSVETKRILIVDDHPIVRDGLATLINEQPDLEVCGGVGTMNDAIDLIEQERPDLAMVDVFLDGPGGIDLTKTLYRKYPEVRVLVLSMHDELVYAERALRAGAMGYVMKQQASRSVIDAVRTVLDGHRYVSKRVSQLLIDRMIEEKRPTFRSDLDVSCLSKREFEIFEMLGNGLTRPDVADALGISVKTVEVHRAHIRQKLNLKHAYDVARHALYWVEAHRQNLIAPSREAEGAVAAY